LKLLYYSIQDIVLFYPSETYFSKYIFTKELDKASSNIIIVSDVFKTLN